MIAYTLKRIFVAFLILLVVSGLTFSLSHIGRPGNHHGEQASDEDIEAVRKLYGFDRPIIEQYGNWLAPLQADFGDSYHYKAPVVEMISGRIGTTMTLGFLAIFSPWWCRSRSALWRPCGRTPSSTASLC